MASYPPPTDFLPIFNPSAFPTGNPNSDLTLAEADSRYVSLSTSQTVNGTKLFPLAVGISSISNTGTITVPTSTGTLALTSQIVDRTTNQSISGTKTFNNQVLVSAGSNSAPSIAFAGGVNTGLYSSGAGNIDFACSGVNVANLSSTGLLIPADLTFSKSGFTNRLTSQTLSANRTLTLPNETGTLALATNNFNLTSTWIAIGDSFTAGGAWGTSWSDTVQTLTSTTRINRGVSATTADYIGEVIGNDFVNNSSYTDVSSIVLYGFNDIRNNLALYSNAYFYTSMLVGQYLTLTCRRSKIETIRSWTTSGVWTDTPVYTGYGRYTSQANAYVEQTNLSGRYYGFRLTAVGGDAVNTEISIGGVLMTEQQRTQPACQSGTYHAYGIVIDMGSVASRTVRITNRSAGGINNYVDFCAVWNDNESNLRPCLVCIPPTFNYAFTGGAPWNAPSDAKRLSILQSIRDAVNTLSKRGLPIYIHETSISDGVVFTDDIHWTSNMNETHARDLVQYSIANY